MSMEEDFRINKDIHHIDKNKNKTIYLYFIKEKLFGYLMFISTDDGEYPKSFCLIKRRYIVLFLSFSRLVWSISFRKKYLVFWYSYIITNFKFRIFIINLFTKVNICIIFNSSRFRFDCAMICYVVFIHYIIWFINIHTFWYFSDLFIDFSF